LLPSNLSPQVKHQTNGMTTTTFPTFAQTFDRLISVDRVREEPHDSPVNDRVAAAVREGLGAFPKKLPPWLFYDRAGSRLFDEITERPEYYLTRTERTILAQHAATMIERAADGRQLRITELGAGSAEKTRLLLMAAVAKQGSVTYEPLDVSASALELAKRGIESDIPQVTVRPKVMDYMQDNRRSARRLYLAHRRNEHGALDFEPLPAGERRLVLYIGSSIGNFEPREAQRILCRVRAGLRKGDAMLLGVDLVKDTSTLLAAYDDFAGVTADFNLNMLARLNRELGAEFTMDSFEHRAVWNESESRIEMHLESRVAQKVLIAALETEVSFEQAETIHTECSYKYAPGQAEAMLRDAGFAQTESWTDEKSWFNVCLARV
jgi:L-histidine Nalpha-methyltransferase